MIDGRDFSVAIIGGGASGLVAAAHLHRSNPARRVALIERTARAGRGVAYGTECDAHLLNVRAARMSALVADDGHFARWLHQHAPEYDGESYAPRRLYGEYLSDLLAQITAPRSGVQLLTKTALGLKRDAANGTWEVQLEGAETISAQFVIFAPGNLPPVNPFRFPPPAKNYYTDPWAKGVTRDLAPDAPVLIIGTGLTMLDLVLALRAAGHRGIIHAVSRRGLRSHGHGDDPRAVLQLPKGHLSPRVLLHWLRKETRAAVKSGMDWQAIVDGLRAETPRLWNSWSPSERRSFVRHARAYWDVHRHRCAPEIAAESARLVASSTLILHRGHLRALQENASGIEARWLKPDGEEETLKIARVINCTGPAADYSRINLPLVVQMREAGWLVPDPLKLGVLTDFDGRMLSAEGAVIPNLFAIGPLRRPSWWESIAIAEIREQADVLARLIEAGS